MSGSFSARVLFVCTGNSCRSVMAEYLFRAAAAARGLRVVAASAGLGVAPGARASRETLELLREDGLDASSHASRPVTEEGIRSSDLILALTDGHAERLRRDFPKHAAKIFLLTDFYEGPHRALYKEGVPDPVRMNRDFYQSTYAAIRSCVQNLVNRLAAEPLGPGKV